MKRLLRDESAQATTEYVLMVSIMVGLTVLTIKKLIQPSLTKLQAALSARMQNILFGGAGFHHIRIGR
jgi:Flp pilus assembly pilin Flp